MSNENVLTIAHQDGAQALRLTNGGYCIQNGRLAIVIETDNMDSKGWPPCAAFYMYSCPIDGELSVGDTFECHGGLFADDDADEATKAHAYFTFWAEEVYIKWTVAEIRGDLVVFKLEAKHDDTNYYDKRAKECPTTGTIVLARKSLSQLGIPA